MDEATTTGPVVIEGTWDEIAARADELRGRRLRVEVVGPSAPSTADKYREDLTAFFARVDAMVPEPSSPTKPDPFGDHLIEKYRKQGLRLEGVRMSPASGESPRPDPEPEGEDAA